MTLNASDIKPVTADQVAVRLEQQRVATAGTPEADPFVVLLYRKEGALAVTEPQWEELAKALHAQAAIHEFLLLANPNAEAFAKLDVEPSTPKLLLFWKGELQHPVWLLDPNEPNLAGWIDALRERDGFPPLTPAPGRRSSHPSKRKRAAAPRG